MDLQARVWELQNLGLVGARWLSSSHVRPPGELDEPMGRPSVWPGEVTIGKSPPCASESSGQGKEK